MTNPTADTIDSLIRDFCRQFGVQPMTAGHMAGLVLGYSATMPEAQAEAAFTAEVLAAGRRQEPWALDYLKCASRVLYPDAVHLVGAARRSGADPAEVIRDRYRLAPEAATELVRAVDAGLL